GRKKTLFFHTTFSLKNTKPPPNPLKYPPFPTPPLNHHAFIIHLPTSFLLNFPSPLSPNTP
ncbi:hypothetical protein, partial [Neisseria sicca]|uniref:hypothetical protein n=1 Tax=Neisseria sicca TaxID=490 RepID=UPI001C98F086